ncbi:hypothetical protein Tco_1448123 [Tanacetum coccineum]
MGVPSKNTRAVMIVDPAGANPIVIRHDIGSGTKVFHNEDGKSTRANIKQALGSYERPHKGVKASANSDIVYFHTSAQDGDPLQDDLNRNLKCSLELFYKLQLVENKLVRVQGIASVAKEVSEVSGFLLEALESVCVKEWRFYPVCEFVEGEKEGKGGRYTITLTRLILV